MVRLEVWRAAVGTTYFRHFEDVAETRFVKIPGRINEASRLLLQMLDRSWDKFRPLFRSHWNVETANLDYFDTAQQHLLFILKRRNWKIRARNVRQRIISCLTLFFLGSLGLDELTRFSLGDEPWSSSKHRLLLRSSDSAPVKTRREMFVTLFRSEEKKVNCENGLIRK